MLEHMGDMRAARVAAAFGELTDTLVADFDLPDFVYLLTERCVELLDISASGLLLADTGGVLRLFAASPYEARVLELLQLEADQGPCVEAYRTGRPVVIDDLDTAAERWPEFAPQAVEAGCRAVHALPLRLRDKVIGALNLFSTEPAPLGEADIRLGQTMADIATIGILSERAIHRTETIAEQLQAALNARVLIEQAKGVLAERLGLDINEAFTVLHTYARGHDQRLGAAAAAVLDGTLDAARLARPTSP